MLQCEDGHSEMITFSWDESGTKGWFLRDVRCLLHTHTHMQSSVSSTQVKSKAWWRVSDSRDKQVEKGKALVLAGQPA